VNSPPFKGIVALSKDIAVLWSCQAKVKLSQTAKSNIGTQTPESLPVK